MAVVEIIAGVNVLAPGDQPHYASGGSAVLELWAGTRVGQDGGAGLGGPACGGGAYSKTTVTVAANAQWVQCTLPIADEAGSGTFAIFQDENNTELCKAECGGTAESAAGPGGLAANGIGDTKFSGGDGGTGSATSGGGGGGGAGSTGSGGNGGNGGVNTGGTAGAAGSGTGGGAGGIGGALAASNGAQGGSRNGGAGGGGLTGVGGAGRNSYGTITFTPSAATEPTIQATAVVGSAIQPTLMTLACTPGNGDKRVCFVKAASSGTPAPVDDTTYTANTVFGSGTQIGSTGWYCVYSGTGSSVSITGLVANTTYRTMWCEFNEVAATKNYNGNTDTGNPANTTTGEQAALVSTTSNAAGTGITIAWALSLLSASTWGSFSELGTTGYITLNRHGVTANHPFTLASKSAVTRNFAAIYTFDSGFVIYQDEDFTATLDTNPAFSDSNGNTVSTLDHATGTKGSTINNPAGWTSDVTLIRRRRRFRRLASQIP